MTIKKLRQNGLDIYHQNETSNWILGLACGLLMAGCFAIGLTVNALLLVIVPFLIIPIFFAGHVAFLAIQKNEKITFGKAFTYFLTYFKNPFNSSFSFVRTFFKCLLVFLILFIIFGPLGYLITNAISPDQVAGLTNELDALIKQGSYTVDQLNYILNKYSDVIISMTYISMFPTSFITLFFFVYYISKNSVSVYYRLSCPVVDAGLLNMIHKYLESKNRRDFLKKYFGLNWPLYVLLAIGFVGGIILNLYLKMDAVVGSTLCCTFALVAVAFYLPFYFPNMQAFFEYLAPTYQQATIDVTNQIMHNVKQAEELKTDNDSKSEIIDIDINKEDNNDQND